MLYFCDGPLVMLLDSNNDEYVCLAVALPEDAGKWPFLIAEVTPGVAQALRDNAITLRRAVVEAVRWFLLPDYDADNLAPQHLLGMPEEWMPGDVPLVPERAA